MRNVVGCLVMAFVVALGSRADAQVLSFDELSPTDIPILGSVVCADATGFRFVSDHFHLIGGSVQQDFSSNGTSHIGYESGRGFPITMERVGGGTFSLLSLDVAEFYAVPGTDRPDAQMLTITGLQQGGGMVSYTVPVDGIHDGPGGVADFEHVVLPGTFVNLTAVVFTGLREGNVSGGVALDNLEYQLPSPEPLAACQAIPLPPETPTVAITSPAPGNVMGTVIVEATATDNVGVASVQFRLDGVDLGAPDTAAPYSMTWDSTTVPDGPHTLTAEARDDANNVSTASVVVTVRNQPAGETSPHYLDFDGGDDFMEVGDADALSFGTGAADGPLTLEMWIRPDAMVRHQLLGKWTDGATSEYKLHIASGAIRLDLRDASAQAIASAFTTGSQTALIGSWHHLAVTYDGRGGATAANGIAIYVDGVAVPLTRINAAAYVAMENLGAPLLVGREGPSWKQYDGALDELRLWRVARTPGEIQAFMTTELSGTEPGLAAYWRFNEGTGAAAFDTAAAHLTGVLYNGPAWVGGGPMGPAEPDTTPPVIGGIGTSNLTPTGVTIGFTTSEAATARVSYTAGVACPCTDVYGAAPGTTHAVTLTGLTPDTTYQFVVHAVDAAGNPQQAPPLSFHTPAPSADTEPPVVSLTSPGPGSVAGTVLLQATASDNVGVVSVQFAVDGVTLGAADTTAPYSVAWDSTTVSNGPHTLTAQALDAANNVRTASVAVQVANGPVSTSPHYLELDGADDYLQVGDADALSFGTGAADLPLTIEAWIRADAMVRHQLLGKWNDSATSEYKLHIASGVVRLDLRDASSGAMVSAFTAGSLTSLIGSWHHLAVTYDGRGGAAAANGIAVYVDGVSVPLNRINAAAYVAMENLAAPLVIGREGPNWKQYDGGLDELRLWNVARTPAAIQATMTTELAGGEPGLVAYWRFNEGLGATASSAAPGSPAATLANGPAWTPGGPLGPATPDDVAPDITNVVTSNLTESSITIGFSTSEAATGWVSYSPGTACPCTEAYAPGTGTTHQIVLAGLTPGTAYQFTVHAADAAGNAQAGPAMSFTTPVPAPDTTPPAVAIVRPSAGTTWGTVLVEATATDSGGVASVQFRLEGADLGPPDTTAPYSVSWNTTTVADGSYTLTAEARDAAGNIATASVMVTVANASVVSSPHYVELDGADDYLQAADADALSFGNGTADTPLTIEAWLRPDAMVRHQLLGKWSDGATSEYKLHIASGVIRLDLRDLSAGAMVSAFTTASYSSMIGGWHHLAVTYDGRGGATAADGITIYVDGVAVPVTRFNNAAYVAMENLAAPLQIGREGPNWRQYDGGLDELRMWNVARTAGDIQSTMMTTLSGAEPGLVAYWRFDEGAGGTAGDAVAGRPAALLNGTVWVAGGSIP